MISAVLIFGVARPRILLHTLSAIAGTTAGGRWTTASIPGQRSKSRHHGADLRKHAQSLETTSQAWRRRAVVWGSRTESRDRGAMSADNVQSAGTTARGSGTTARGSGTTEGFHGQWGRFYGRQPLYRDNAAKPGATARWRGRTGVPPGTMAWGLWISGVLPGPGAGAKVAPEGRSPGPRGLALLHDHPHLR